MPRWRMIAVGLLALGWSAPGWGQANLAGMVLLPRGGYAPFFAQDNKRSIPMAAFWLDRVPVTNRQYADFVTRIPQWQKSAIKAVFSDSRYLETWRDDRSWGGGDDGASQPVTRVSWFAADAYCRALGKTLPTTDQWEYALADGGRGKEHVDALILDWYGRPNSQQLPTVDQADENGYGIRGLVGLVWEWTLDFNSVMSGAELRQTGKDKELVCGAGTLGAANAADYAAFMRFSMRSSLKATYTTPNLGFRCAKEAL